MLFLRRTRLQLVRTTIISYRVNHQDGDPSAGFHRRWRHESATTTLHEQLARQPGVFMSSPKEPNFFSDDGNYARGLDWYSSHFVGARRGEIRGESSTHYTKLPTFPRTVERMVRDVPRTN